MNKVTVSTSMVVSNKQVFSKTNKDRSMDLNMKRAQLDNKLLEINNTEIDVTSPSELNSFDFEAQERTMNEH